MTISSSKSSLNSENGGNDACLPLTPRCGVLPVGTNTHTTLVQRQQRNTTATNNAHNSFNSQQQLTDDKRQTTDDKRRTTNGERRRARRTPLQVPSRQTDAREWKRVTPFISVTSPRSHIHNNNHAAAATTLNKQHEQRHSHNTNTPCTRMRSKQ